MSAKPVILRERASRDIDEAIAYYLGEDAEDAALGFIDALEDAYKRLGRHPGIGSPRYSHELGITGLRSWTLKRHPYLIFYVDQEEHVDVWRVLHAERDIPTWMNEEP